MIERIIEFSARNQFIVYLLVGFLVVIGFWAVKQVPLDAIPDLTDTQVIIFTEWMGRSPNLVEDQITYPIVSAMLSAPRVKAVRGQSMFGMSFIYVIFQDGTDIYWARSRVLEYLSQLQGKFPTGVAPQLGPDATGVGWVYEYALVDQSGTHDLAELRAFQDWHLRYWLASVPGVAEVASVGGFEKQYQVDLDPSRLVAYNLPISDVIAAIRAGNNDVGGRSLEMTGKEYVVRGQGYITSTDQLRKVVVARRRDGTPLLLDDVATVHLGPEMRRGLTELDGQGEVVGGIVVMRYGENALNVIDRVKAKIREVEPGLPKGVKIVSTYDRSDLIRRSIATLRRTLIEEAVIVSLVIIIFLLHVPSALRAIVTLPIAVLLAFIPMKLMGLTANIMSLGGIAIAIGAMVDEAVVMIENVHKKLEHAPPDADRKELIIQACKEIGRPLFFSLMVITVSFLPVFTLEGQAGRLFKPLAYTKTFSMFAAALLSITLAPALMLLLAPKHIVPETRHPISRSLQRIYHPWMSALMRRRFLSISLAAIAVLSCLPILLLGKLGSEFMPPLNERDILYMPTTLPGVSITEASRILQVQDKLIKEFPEVERVFGKAGKAQTSTDPAPLDMMETTILLKPEDQWRTIHLDRWYSGWAPSWIKPTLRRVWPEEGPITWEGLRDRLDQRLQLPGVTNAWTMPIKARIDMLTTGIRTPVGIKIFGPDLDRIQSIGQQVEAVIRDVPGTRSVYAERTTGGYYVDIIPRREQAARYGLSVAQVEDIVESAIGGTPISTTIEGPERFTINVRYARELRDDLDRLSHVLVPIPAAGGAADGAAQAAGPGGGAMGASSAGAGSGMGGAMGAGVSGSAGSPTSSIAPSGIPEWSRGFDTPRMGAAVPLGQIADIVVSTGPPMIKDEAASLTGWVYIDVVDRDIGRYVEDAKKAVAKIPLPAGYYLSWTGQYELLEVMRQRMKIVIPITLLIIVVMLYLNSKSVASTIIVLLSVPFAVTGSIWMLYLHNLLRPQDPWNLSVAVAVGMIALAGLAAETGVVMIVYLDEAYHRYKAEGRMNTQHDLFHAITEGAVQRVRPKLMTVMCILMGLVPLMWAHGAGADVMRRIAAPMIGGVITSSILTLEIVPAIYSLWRGRSVTWVKDGREGASAGSEQAK
ncbi:MAG: CusA/CzcA family heavy metal efflux RND transporter [Armatimonadota bacterium]|jgi:Cu(I)/Ag(I) efflux system membrane protein CusA/SilA